MASEAPPLQWDSFSREKNVVGRALRLPDSSIGHPPRIPVWLRWEQSVIYFVTICVEDRKQVLANKAAFNAFKNTAAKFRGWRVLAAILMADHLDVVVAPTERHARLGISPRRLNDGCEKN